MWTMRSRLQAVTLPVEVGEFAEDVHQIFAELGRALGPLGGECSPPVDVFESDEAVEVAVDLPGVDADALRIIIKGNALLVAGEKAPRRTHGDSTFHLVERGFGRFARAVRLSAPCDTTRAHATLREGELRITVPKIAERRGRTVRVAVTTRGATK
jgi:HSP20 family protein